jgi:hypothetical protein
MNNNNDQSIEYDKNDPNNIIKQASRAFFLVCNKYIKDRGITLEELTECLPNLNSDIDNNLYGLDKITSWYNSNPKQLFHLLDLNHDNYITEYEYENILDNNFSDISNQETVKIKTRDGKIREITREELFKLVNVRNEEHSDGITREGDNIYKNTFKSGSIEEIAKDNPDIARFVAIGKWIQDELTKIDIECEILHMKSLPDGGSINLKENINNNNMNNFNENKDYNIWIEMTITNSNKHNKNQMRKFEFHIIRDKNKYIRPYLGIVNAWELDINNTRINNFTIPQIMKNFTTNNNNSINTSNMTISNMNISIILLGSIIYFLILVFIIAQLRKLLKRKRNEKDG